MKIQKVTIRTSDILTATDAARYLGVSRMTIWRWVKSGKITPIMLDHNYFHINELKRVKKHFGKSDNDGKSA